MIGSFISFIKLYFYYGWDYQTTNLSWCGLTVAKILTMQFAHAMSIVMIEIGCGIAGVVCLVCYPDVNMP